jgi:HAMP domain-containing protein
MQETLRKVKEFLNDQVAEYKKIQETEKDYEDLQQELNIEILNVINHLEEKDSLEKNSDSMTTKEMLDEYGELASRFNSLNDEELKRLGEVYDALLDTTDSVGNLYNEMMVIAEVIGEFLRERDLNDDFVNYLGIEVKKRLGIGEVIQ